MTFKYQVSLLAPLVSSLVMSGLAKADTETNALQLAPLNVTANKIEENILTVPQAVSVLSEYDLEDKGIQQVTDVVKEIPNMSVQTNGGSRVSFRGLSSSLFTNNNPVVVYIDGVPSTDYYDFDASLANVERVEVLRGPQGTLYGKDAIGAVINIVTKQPDNEWQGNVGVEAGSHNRLFGSFNANGAVIDDTLFVGINGQGFKDDGWIENDYPGADKAANKKDNTKFGAYVLYTPTEDFKAKLNLQHHHRTGFWWDAYGLPSGADLSEFNRDDAEFVTYDVPQKETVKTDSQSLNLLYRFDKVEFDSTTVHKNVDMDGLYDADFGNGEAYAGLSQFNQNESESWSQEFKLSNNLANGTRWVSGLYFDKSTRRQAPSGMEFPFYADMDGDQVPETFVGNYRMNSESQTNSETLAVFGQVMVPFYDAWEVTLGSRLQRIQKDIDLNMFYLPKGTEGDSTYHLAGEHTWHKILPKAALSYQFNDDWMMYGSYSKGYMPGGYNYYAMQGSEQDNRFDAQTSDNYEIGLKASFDTVTLSANAFYMDIQDIHVYKEIGSLYLTSNAEKAHSQGLEVEANWFATENIQISTALGVTEATYDKYDAGSAHYDGQHVIETPSHTLRLSFAYDPGEAWYGRLDALRQGGMYFFDDANEKISKRSGFTVFDVKMGYREDDWNLYLFANNVTDEKYIRGFISNSLVSVATFGEPRTLGVGAHYQF